MENAIKSARLKSIRTFVWGNNEYGQLGIKTISYAELYPKEVKIGEVISQISWGDKFTLLLSEEGKVYSWGDNSELQLGTGKSGGSLNFWLIQSFDGIKISKISAGSHSMAISSQGSLMIWGKTSIGTFEFPESISYFKTSIVDCSVGTKFSAALDSLQRVWIINNPFSKFEPEIVNSLTSKNITGIYCGGSHTIIKGSDVWSKQKILDKISGI